MKKLLCGFLFLICLFSIVGCKRSNSGLEFLEMIRSIDFSMTLETVKKSSKDVLTEEKSKEGEDAFLYYDAIVNGYSGKIIYRFDGVDRTLDFIKFIFDNEDDFESYMTTFKENYGEPKKVKNDDQCWYGTVNGVDVVFAANDEFSMLEISKN